MGNLIQDFWTYTAWNGQKYFGACEVVKGDLRYRSVDNKQGIHIERALSNMMTPGHNWLSHMSVQTYAKKIENIGPNEDVYYPFLIEFEPKCKDFNSNFKRQYKEAVGEALRATTYLIYELGLNEKDILILINNSRSVYVMVNPKTYNLMPSRSVHKVYQEIFNKLDETLGFKYADENFYAQNGLMKTPNSFYKGGYVVPVSLKELKCLYEDQSLKAVYTSKQRSLNYNIPAQVSLGMTSLYEEAVANIKETKPIVGYNNKAKRNQVKFIERNQGNCIKFIENNIIEKGCRNHALVSVAIYYKEKGYDEEQILEKLVELAEKWEHDETFAEIKAKVRTVFRYDYKFSCSKAQSVLDIDMESLCATCPYNKNNSCKNTKIIIHEDIIDDLWANGASTRHYLAYLDLARNNLLNKWFNPKEIGMSDRVIRELCTYSKKLIRQKNKELIFIAYKAEGNAYYLPFDFVDNKVYLQLGDYIKHYLKLVFKGYRSYTRYIIMNLTKEKIQEQLGYKNISGVYKLLSKLDELGLLVINKGKVKALYFESKRVINIDECKRPNKEKESCIEGNRDTGKAVVNGNTYIEHKEKERGSEYKNSINKSINRGSPG